MAQASEPTRKIIRKLRHWKQRFDKNARFVWRRDVLWGAHQCRTGEPIPEWILKEMGRTKLRRLWESRRIELAEFEDADAWPQGPPPDAAPPPESPSAAAADASLPEAVTEVPDPLALPAGVTLTKNGGGWYTLGTDIGDVKIQGKAKLVAALEELRADAAEA
jgi:hypothetical protein